MLDVSIRMGVLNLMARLKEERGIGYLYITHDIASARYIGDRTIVMYAGHMVEGAESEALMGKPRPPVYAAPALGGTQPARGAKEVPNRGARRNPFADRPTPRLPLRRPLPQSDGRVPTDNARCRVGQR